MTKSEINVENAVRFLLNNKNRLHHIRNARYMGIDPGISGAIVVLSKGEEDKLKIDSVTLIEDLIDKNGKLITEKFYKVIERIALENTLILTQELPGLGMPGAIARSAEGKLVQMSYQMKGIIETFFLIYYWISEFRMIHFFPHPNEWYESLGIGNRKDKKETRKKKTLEFVKNNIIISNDKQLMRSQRCRTLDHNIVDAVAIATTGYCYIRKAESEINTPEGEEYWQKKIQKKRVRGGSS